MPGKLLRHPRPKDGLASRMMKNALRISSLLSYLNNEVRGWKPKRTTAIFIPALIRLHKHQSGFEAICCHIQKSNFSASCISLGSRVPEITAKFDAPKIRPHRVKFG
jgi:hypothetical protein